MDPYITVNQQFFDVVFIVSLLIVVRPKVWPAYYSLAFLDDLQDLLENEENLPLVQQYVLQQNNNNSGRREPRILGENLKALIPLKTVHQMQHLIALTK